MEFYLESVKVDVLKKNPGKLRLPNTADLIPFKVEETSVVTVISPTRMFFFYEGEKFVEHLSVLTPEAATRSDILYLVREIGFFL